MVQRSGPRLNDPQLWGDVGRTSYNSQTKMSGGGRPFYNSNELGWLLAKFLQSSNENE